LLFQLARGWLEGVIQPVILSVQARAVGRHQQGAVVGLRQTGQRLSSFLIPPVMGGLADRFGTSQSFLIYAAFMLPLCGLLALILRRLRSGTRRSVGGSPKEGIRLPPSCTARSRRTPCCTEHSRRCRPRQ